MRILIFGGDGMLGHQLWESWHDRHEVWGTVRKDKPAGTARGERLRSQAISGVDVRRLGDVVDAVAVVRPDVVVNAVGIVKQRQSAKEHLPSIEVNALFPHRLARVAQAAGARMVHLSTDCVFSGDKGRYVESDRPDPVDLYGRSKLLGEVADSTNCLTLRTSIIGLELGSRGRAGRVVPRQRGKSAASAEPSTAASPRPRWPGPSSISSCTTPACVGSGICRRRPSTSTRFSRASWRGCAPGT